MLVYQNEMSGLRVHAFSTGHVKVKKAHRQWRGPTAFRLPALMASVSWTEWLPIWCWLVELPDMKFMVDTGETHRVKEPDWFKGDSGNEWMLKRILRFDIEEKHTLEAQLRKSGIDPESIDFTILTHAHTDHTGGLSAVAGKPVIMSRTEYDHAMRAPRGAVPHQWPKNMQVKPTDLPHSDSLFKDADHSLHPNVSIVATPGHTAGHQSVIVRDNGLSLFFAGDVTFNQEQLLHYHLPGITENSELAVETIAAIRSYSLYHPTIYMPSHDPESVTRLMEQAVVERKKIG
ncbi:N-acyl homoserine lactonase family protein [Jeotgalibacillus aurantiacus]|uniref:N-acyl homoserine lactonase family protein n=1 Tax=Jeotgalibacillus aurantiacus TaxID=2763266 RepID=UPI001D0B418A|nr:N-acyl homoserine lactonase family protein [Jeotgalibacillus aurantiacus]